MPMGSAGDVHPFVGLAIELQRRGHQVTLLTNGYFSELASRFGLEMIELSSRGEFHAGIASKDLWHPIRSFSHLYHQLVYPTIDKQYEVIERFASKGPVTVVANCFGFGALIAQEKLGVPVISVHLQPVMLWSRHQPPQIAGLHGPRWMKNIFFSLLHRFVVDPIVLPTLNPLRKKHSLPPVKGVMHWWHSKTMILCLFPKWFCPPQPDWPKPLHQVDFPMWDESESIDGRQTAVLPEAIEEFLSQGAAPVVFTPGSANIFGVDFFKTAVETCRILGLRAIFLTRFSEQIPDPLPAYVLHVPFVPLSQLLPRSAAFVHHGGIGSASQAMYAGIPQLVWPLAHDQFDNAIRIKKLGIGDSLEPKYFTPKRLAAKLDLLLKSALIAMQCKIVASRIQRGEGIAEAVDILERHASFVSR